MEDKPKHKKPLIWRIFGSMSKKTRDLYHHAGLFWTTVIILALAIGIATGNFSFTGV